MGRLAPSVFKIPTDKIRAGYYTDRYFLRTRDVLIADRFSSRVSYQFFPREDAVISLDLCPTLSDMRSMIYPYAGADRLPLVLILAQPRSLLSNNGRGCPLGKSWIAAAFVLWTLWNDRDKKILVVSASKQRADDFTIFTQKCILEFEWLAHMRPVDDDQRWSRVSFDVAGCRPAQSPSVKSVGITGQLTGSRADLIIFDDVEVPANSATDLMREKLLQLVTEGESVLHPSIIAMLLKRALGLPNEQNKVKGKENLSEREIEVLRLAATGMSNKEIAEIPVYIDGMVWDVTAIHTAYPEYLNNRLRAQIFQQGENPLLSSIFKTR
jgi:hypothetical protein